MLVLPESSVRKQGTQPKQKGRKTYATNSSLSNTTQPIKCVFPAILFQPKKKLEEDVKSSPQK